MRSLREECRLRSGKAEGEGLSPTADPGIALSDFGRNVPHVNAPSVEGPTAPPIEDPVAAPYQQALCSLPFGFALHDASLRYVYVNDALAAINGCAAAAHAGKAVEEILPAPVAAEVRTLLATALATGIAAPRVRVRGQTTRDQGERVFDCDYVPVWHAAANRTGKPTHVAALVRDVTSEAGMSDQLGMVQLAPRENPYLGTVAGFQGPHPYSEQTAQAIDAEVQRIIAECHAEATRQLTGHRAALDRLAAALLTRETLDTEDILEVTGLPPAPPLPAAPRPG